VSLIRGAPALWFILLAVAPAIAFSKAPGPDGTMKFLQKSTRNDCHRLRDGFDGSRDITGVIFEEGRSEDPFTIRIEVAHAGRHGGWKHCVIYVLLDIDGGGRKNLPEGMTGTSEMGWNIMIKTSRSSSEAYDEKGTMAKGAVRSTIFDLIGNAVELKIDKALLREKGWKEGKSFRLQAFTTGDSHRGITDSLDLPHQKPWNRGGCLSSFMDVMNPAPPPAVRDEDWGDDIIYFILTDRFKDGDFTNNLDVDRGGQNRFHGGDLQGIIDSLDYLQARHVTALWISPPLKAQKEFMKSAGYHGYWPVDFYSVDPHQGTMEKFGELLQKAHQKGLKVLLDLPLNHTAWEHPWAHDPARYEWFHHKGSIKNWNDDRSVEEGDMYGLPDLAQENPPVYRELLKISRFWIDTGIDGFRLDAVRHVPRDFWIKFEENVHDYAGPDFFLLGEYFHGWDKKLAPYQSDGMDSLFDMPLMYTMSEVFAKEGSMTKLAEKIAQEEQIYENPSMMSAFLDNQDQPRFITQAGANGTKKLRLALAFLMTVNRIPVIYYGTEAAMEGNHDIMKDDMANRKNMEPSINVDMCSYFDCLTSLRKNSSALKRGAFREMWSDDSVYGFSRLTPDEEAIIILNNDNCPQAREIPLRAESSLEEGAELIDALTGVKLKVAMRKIKMVLSAKQALILFKNEPTQK
jgi:alpha-amylase